MLRFILLAILIAFASGESGADVFGLKKGMSVAQIRTLNLGKMRMLPNTYGEQKWAVLRPNTPEGADRAVFFVVPGKGLLKVFFLWDIQTNSFGDGVKTKFEELKKILSDKYGKGETHDILKPNSAWDRPEDWMDGLRSKDRLLVWFVVAKETPHQNLHKNKIETISIRTGASSPVAAFVTLSYELEGWAKHVKERDAKEF